MRTAPARPRAARDAMPPSLRRGASAGAHRHAVMAMVATILLLTGCTGTFTPALPTVVVVVRDAVPGEGRPAVLALVALDLLPDGRSLRVIEDRAFSFAPGERVLALDATPRDTAPDSAWALTRPDASSPARTLYRFDLGEVRDEAGATVPSAAPPRPLVTADGGWAPDLDAALATEEPACLDHFVVGGPTTAPRRYVALWDACDASSDPLLHVVDLEEDVVISSLVEPAPLHPVGLRAGLGDAATFTLGTVEIGGAVRIQTRAFADPSEDQAPEATVAAATPLLDLAVADGVWWALVQPTSGVGALLRIAPDGTVTERPAPTGARRVVAARSPGALLLAPDRAQVVFPDTASPEVFLSPAGALIEANDYAVVARTGGGLCVLDAQVPAVSAGCEFSLAPSELTGARLLTWTYAAP